MEPKRVLIILGGTWHDFDGFAQAMRALLEPRQWAVESTYNLERLTRLDEAAYDLVLSYTCFTKHTEGLENAGPEKMPEKMTDAQINALTTWVQNGGAFLAAHAASVLGESGPQLGDLIGGVFAEHPPESTFTVYPLYGVHPITAGIEAFNVYDELYIERCDPSVELHMLALHEGVAHPLVWSKAEGRGRVAHVALGHSVAVWQLASYQQLMLQTVAWLTEER
jgi:type 1 glutamine amidotransferase